MYKIKSMKGFSAEIGKFVAKNAGYTKKEFQSFIKHSNLINIVKTYVQKRNGSLFIDEESASKICDEIFDWLVGVEMSKLAAEDIIDCYWDNNKNQMVFMPKIENENSE